MASKILEFVRGAKEIHKLKTLHEKICLNWIKDFHELGYDSTVGPDSFNLDKAIIISAFLVIHFRNLESNSTDSRFDTIARESLIKHAYLLDHRRKDSKTSLNEYMSFFLNQFEENFPRYESAIADESYWEMGRIIAEEVLSTDQFLSQIIWQGKVREIYERCRQLFGIHHKPVSREAAT